MNKIIIITGCSSGIGLETTLLLSKNNKVYATLRNLKDLGSIIKNNKPNLTFAKMDVRNEKEFQKN